MRNHRLSLLVALISLSSCLSKVVERNVRAVCDTVDPTQIAFFPVEGDCTKYIECFNYVGTMLECPNDLWWHQAIQSCDVPGSYCEWWAGTTTVDPRCVEGTTNYFPHPTTCTKYIECYEDSSYERTCPDGLFFSASHQTCVNAEFSECCHVSDEC